MNVNMHSNFLSSRLLATCLLAAVFSLAQLNAIERLPEDQRRNGKSTLEAFADSSEAGLASTVRLVRNGRSLSLGTIMNKQGLVITKASVCIGAQNAILADGTSYPVRIRRRDKDTDLALLKIRGAKDLTPVSWVVPRSAGAAAGLKKGDVLIKVNGTKVTSREKVIEMVGGNDPGDVVALEVKRGEGNLSFRVTLGHRSVTFDMFDRNARMSGAVSKRKDNFPMIIQHDVSLPPSAMGGPVLDLNGKSLGVNVARVDRVTTYALPAKLVRETFDKLRRAGRTRE